MSGVKEAKKFDSEKLDFTLIPPVFTKAVAERLTEGAAKYERHNYLNSIKDPDFDTRILAALLRHAEELKIAIDAEDDESKCTGDGKLHLTAVATCCLMLIHRLEERYL